MIRCKHGMLKQFCHYCNGGDVTKTPNRSINYQLPLHVALKSWVVDQPYYRYSDAIAFKKAIHKKETPLEKYRRYLKEEYGICFTAS